MKLFLCITLLFIQACVSHPIIYGSGEVYKNWHDSIIEKCAIKAAALSYQIIEDQRNQGILVTREQGFKINKYLMEKCSMNSGVSV